MGLRDETARLIHVIEKHRAVLGRLEAYYRQHAAEQSPYSRRSQADAIVLSDVFAKHYTCLQTVFLRISRFFENDLAADRWHKDLLEKMTLDIPACVAR